MSEYQMYDFTIPINKVEEVVKDAIDQKQNVFVVINVMYYEIKTDKERN